MGIILYTVFMPRRNKSSFSPRRLSPVNHEQGKVRYPSKSAALQQIKEIQKYNPDIGLSTYQSPSDNGWYLTSSIQNDIQRFS